MCLSKKKINECTARGFETNTYLYSAIAPQCVTAEHRWGGDGCSRSTGENRRFFLTSLPQSFASSCDRTRVVRLSVVITVVHGRYEIASGRARDMMPNRVYGSRRIQCLA